MRPRHQAAQRNVEVFDSGGAVVAGGYSSLSLCHSIDKTLPGFWQHGSLQWDEFYQHLRTFIVTSTDWTIFQYEPTKQQHGAPCPSGASIVQEGTYILLSTGEQQFALRIVKNHKNLFQLANQFEWDWHLFPHRLTTRALSRIRTRLTLFMLATKLILFNEFQ